MKPTSSFKLNRATKKMLSSFKFPNQQSETHFRKHMILAQLFSEQAQRTGIKQSKEVDQA